VKPVRTFVMAAVTAACLAMPVLRAQTPAASQTLTMEGYPAIGSPSIVKLLDAGAQPRKQLRYAVPATFKRGIDMTMNMAAQVNAAGMAMPMGLGLKMNGDVAVSGVAPNGDITYALTFTSATSDGSADANPAMAAAMEAVKGAITSIKGSGTISSRGVVKSSKLEAGDIAQAQQMMGEFTTQIEELTVALPEEAVGVGAKWETRTANKAAGQTSFQKKTYEVVAIDGSVVKLKYTLEQTFPQQTITNPMMPGEVQMDASKGSGTGTGEIRLDSLIPTGESTSTSTISMSINMGGQTIPMSMENTVKLTIAPAPVK